MARVPPILATPLVALGICIGAGGLGLAVNALRPHGLRLVAAFPYEQDCPDKTQLHMGPTVTPEEARQLARGAASRVLFLDARPREDFDQGHIDGARSFPYSFVTPPTAADVVALRPYAQLIVYCDSPGDKLAGLLAEQLRGLGLTTVRVLRGGLDAYGQHSPGGRP
jgi:rhodanese-related sulfurtransferase